MMGTDRISAAERASRGRAAIMAIAAVVLMVNAVIEVGSPVYSSLSLRGGVWILLVLMWLLILATGGGLTTNRERKRLMNDELSLQNRARAMMLGFYVTMIAAMLVYAGSWFQEIGTHDSLRLVSAAGLSSALGRYAWLEVM